MQMQLVNYSGIKMEKKIEVKKENRGKFTEFCTRKGYEGVTDECISEGLASKNAVVRKRANFAKNAREWSK